jgi:hypothetical protein
MKTRFSLNVILLSALFFIAIPFTGLSQETSSCAETLKNAQSLFDRGQVEKIPDVLRECMRSGFKREEQLAAYKLLIQSYILGDKLAEADSAMLAFLKQNPEYQLSPTDHASFVYLYNSFNVKPVVQLVLHIGTNLPFVTFVNPVSVSAEIESWNYSSNALNLFASLEAKYALTPKLEVNIEPGYSQLSFTNTEDWKFARVNYSETQHRLEIPISATYNFKTFSKFTAYARAGAGPAFNLISNAKKVSYNENGEITFKEQSITDIDRKDSRIKMDLFGQAGAGLKFKIPKGYLNFEIRMNLGIYNQIQTGGESAELLWDIRYKDDDFNLNAVNFSFGYTQIFYKPSKRK